MFCPNCKKEFDSQCCPNCGYNPAQPPQQQQQPYVQQVIVQQPKKKHGCLIGIVVFIVLIVIISVAAGGSDDNDGDKSSEKSVSVSTADKKTTTAKTDDESPADEVSTPTDDTGFKEQVIWEFDDVTITLTDIDYDAFLGTEFKIRVENNSSRNIMILSDSVDVNGFTVSAALYTEVSAGKKATDSFTVYSSDLEDAGIDDIEEVELHLHATDTDNYNKVAESDSIVISLS
jgi:hypothetical protein